MALAAEGNFLSRIFLPEKTKSSLKEKVFNLFPNANFKNQPDWLKDLAQNIEKYFSCGTPISKTFLKFVAWNSLPSFQKTTLLSASEIPFGKSIYYSDLAKIIQKPKACRAVGSALGKNPLPLLVPCHRIVSRQKNGGGFSAFGGLDTKKSLLELECNSLKTMKLGQVLNR